jgi:DNA-binding transcriptional LysR family regulator
LGVTIPAVSFQIKALEQELGVELFHRLPNKLVLTDRGRIFLAESVKIAAAVQQAAAAVMNKETPTREVSLAIGYDLTKFFAPAIAKIVQSNMRTKLSLLTASSIRGLALLLDDEIDFSLGFYHAVPNGVHRYKLLDTGISLLFNPKYFDINVKSLDLKAIGKHRIMMMRTSRTRNQIDNVLARRGIVFENILEVGSCQSAIDFARLGLGIGLVHEICAGQFHQSSRELTEVKMSRTFGRFDISLAVKPETLLSDNHSAFADSLIRASRSLT